MIRSFFQRSGMLKRKTLLYLLFGVCLGLYAANLKHQLSHKLFQSEVDDGLYRRLENAISTRKARREKIENEPGLNYKELTLTEENVLQKVEKQVRRELQNYSFHAALKTHNVTQLIPQFGGNPVINLLVTTWRSGSTFMGDLLDVHPATMYHYEPFLDFGIIRPKYGRLGEKAQHYLRQLLTCNYTQMEAYIDYGKTHNWLFTHNSRLWSVCSKSRGLCQSADFLSRFCALFPFQAMKTVRLPLNATKEILRNKKLDVRVLLLVRDPRGTMQSRRHREWCGDHPDCYHPASLCADLVNDYHDAQNLSRLFPGRIRVIRYEDLCLNLDRVTREVFDFFRLSYSPQVRKFIETHSKETRGGVSSTFRDSKAAAVHWKDDLSYEEVDAIQVKCHRAMDLFGYRLAHSAENLKQLDPLANFTSPVQ